MGCCQEVGINGARLKDGEYIDLNLLLQVVHHGLGDAMNHKAMGFACRLNSEDGGQLLGGCFGPHPLRWVGGFNVVQGPIACLSLIFCCNDQFPNAFIVLGMHIDPK